MMVRAIRLIFILIFGFLLILNASAQSSQITGTVKDMFGSLPGARVAIEGTTIFTSTDVNGHFILEVDPGDYTIKASFVMYSTDSQPVTVFAGDSVNIEFQLSSGFSIDEEVSVGTRARPRSLLETTVPVDILSKQNLNSTPQVELGQILHYTSATFNSVHQTISDGTDHIDPATLRGLGPDQVLVLINGKRRHTSSMLNINGTLGRGSVGTDFNAIPFGAVDRVEILRDGAAAQYGSDAIAGVVNIILKEQTGITHVDGYAGQNIEGDGLQTFYNANVGFDIGDGGFINLTLEFRNREATNRSGRYTGDVFTSVDDSRDQSLIESTDFFNNTGFDDGRVMEIGNSATRNLSFFFNAEVPISSVISFYSHGGRNFRNGDAAGFYRFPKDSTRVVHEVYPFGFSPRIFTEIQDDAVTVGIRGVRNNWNIDFSNTNGTNSLDFNVYNSNNASYGQASPVSFYSGGYFYNQNTTNFDAFRNFRWLNGVNLAFGAELRIENFQLNAGEEESYNRGPIDTIFVEGNVPKLVETGSQVFPGFQPQNELNEFRTNSSWYIDIESKLSKRLFVGTAGRLETYSDFGDQAIWKISSRYKILDNFSFSAGLATGFRAPSLHQLYFNSTSTQFFAGTQARRVATLDNEEASIVFGIDQLQPELSNHISAGLVAKVRDNISVTLDYYNIKIEDRIVLSGSFSEGFEEELSILGVDEAQFFTNAIDTETNGADLVVNYKTSLGGGEFYSLSSLNITKTRVVGEVKTSAALKGQESTLFDREQVSRIEVLQPNYKFINQSSFKRQKLTVNFNNTLFGRVKYIHPNPDPTFNELTGESEPQDQTFKPKLVTDLLVSWQFNDYVKLTVGGHNIFDVYPDKHAHSANISSGRFVYSRRVQQFGVKGAYYFMKLSLSL